MEKRLGAQDEEEDEVKVAKVVSDDSPSGAIGVEVGDAGVISKKVVLVEEAMKVGQLPSQGEGAHGSPNCCQSAC